MQPWTLTESSQSDWVTESLTHSLELLRTTVVATNSTLTAGVPSPTGVAQLAQRPAGLFNHSRHQNQDNWVQRRSQVIREETPGCVGFFLFYLVERLIERCFELKKKRKKKAQLKSGSGVGSQDETLAGHSSRTDDVRARVANLKKNIGRVTRRVVSSVWLKCSSEMSARKKSAGLCEQEPAAAEGNHQRRILMERTAAAVPVGGW